MTPSILCTVNRNFFQLTYTHGWSSLLPRLNSRVITSFLWWPHLDWGVKPVIARLYIRRCTFARIISTTTYADVTNFDKSGMVARVSSTFTALFLAIKKIDSLVKVKLINLRQTLKQAILFWHALKSRPSYSLYSASIFIQTT